MINTTNIIIYTGLYGKFKGNLSTYKSLNDPFIY